MSCFCNHTHTKNESRIIWNKLFLILSAAAVCYSIEVNGPKIQNKTGKLCETFENVGAIVSCNRTI